VSGRFPGVLCQHLFVNFQIAGVNPSASACTGCGGLSPLVTINTETALEFFHQRGRVSWRRRVEGDYLEYLIRNDIPAVMLPILKAGVRV